jgi:hypothetical protein
MNPSTVEASEVEDDRQQVVREMEEASGSDWAKEFLPGTNGCHELLDRTSVMMDTLERHLLQHPACVANADWYALAEQAASALRELYQHVGREHLESSN